MSVKGATSTTNSPADQIPHEKIAMRAYDKWLKRGCPAGTDKQDWQEAERELQEERRRGTPARR
jgi:hypothetical protein